MSDFATLFVMSILVQPASGHVLAGTSQGLLRSANAGRTWKKSEDNLAVMSLADGIGTGDLLAGRADGVAISCDGGETWQSTLSSSLVSAVVRANDAGGVQVVLAGTERDGVYRSLDDGRTWQPALAGLRSLEVLCLAPSPGFDVDHTVYAGTASGLHRSRNGGKAWRPISLGMEPEAVQAIAVTPDGLSVWVGTESRGLFVSGDGGITWEPCPALGEVAIGAITVAGGLVMVATESSIWACTAGPSDWQRIAEVDGVLCLHVADDRMVLVGTAGSGLLRLENDGTSWFLVKSEIDFG